MLLGKKLKSPVDVKRYVVDYTDWLDTGETLTDVTYAVEDSADATITSTSISGDGKSAIFFVNSGVVGETFNVYLTVITSVAQTKEDHLEFVVVAP